MGKDNYSDYDSGWKEAIENYFQEFMLFFFPEIYEDIDFDAGFEFSDKEFNKIVKESVEKKRYVDKLVKVYLKDGKEKWILIHIEIQSSYEKEFEKRLYVYNYRISDRYNKDVITLAVLTDGNKNYRPDNYQVQRWGFEITFRFPLIKLIDFKDKIDLEKARNPFEIITFAHLKNLETQKDAKERLFWKITLVKLLYGKGYNKKDILNLYSFLDWIMVLPKKHSYKFHEEIIKYEEEQKMPFITTAERIGIERGIERGIEKSLFNVLKIRFGAVDKETVEVLETIKEIEILEVLLEKAIKANTLEEFGALLRKYGN